MLIEGLPNELSSRILRDLGNGDPFLARKAASVSSLWSMEIFSQITKLRVNASDKILKERGDYFGALQELTIEKGGIWKYGDEWLSGITQFPRLKKLVLRSVQIQFKGDKGPYTSSLEEILLSGGTVLDTTPVSFPELHTIRLLVTHGVFNIKNVSALRSLWITGCCESTGNVYLPENIEFLSSRGNIVLQGGMESLRVLHFSGRLMLDKSVSLRGLKILIIEDCRNKGISRDIISQAPNIEYVISINHGTGKFEALAPSIIYPFMGQAAIDDFLTYTNHKYKTLAYSPLNYISPIENDIVRWIV